MINLRIVADLIRERDRQDEKYGEPVDRFKRWANLNPPGEAAYYCYVLEMGAVLNGEAQGECLFAFF